MHFKSQKTLLIFTICLVVIACIGGAVIGLSSGYVFKKTEKNNITPVTFYELVVTQVITHPTCTAQPTQTGLPQPSPTQPTIITPTPGFTPAAIPIPTLTTTPEAILLEAFSWNVYPGDQAFVKIRVDPGLLCSIEYFDPLGKKVEDPLLASQLSNEYGTCYWNWEIDEKSPIGVGTVSIQVNNLEKSLLIQITKKE